jgi:hypothetical protein
MATAIAMSECTIVRVDKEAAIRVRLSLSWWTLIPAAGALLAFRG